MVNNKSGTKKKIYLVEPLGKDTLLYFETETGNELISVVDSNSKFKAGDTPGITFPEDQIFLFDKNGDRVSAK